MTFQSLENIILTLKWVEETRIREDILVATDIEDIVLAHIPLDITPKTNMAEIYINEGYLEPEDVKQLKKWLSEYARTPLNERSSIRLSGENNA